MRFYLAIIPLLLAGCSTQQRSDVSDAHREDGAVPATYSEWPGYYDPNYPYYYSLPEMRTRETRPAESSQPRPADPPTAPAPRGF